MGLSDQQLSDFRSIYESRFGRQINREEALEQGERLIRLLQLVYRPISRSLYQEVERRQVELDK